MPKEIEPEEGEEKESSIKTFFKNHWAVATVVLAVLLLLVLFTNITGMTITGSAISQSSAEAKVIEFAESRGIDAKVVDTEDLGVLYEITLTIQNQPAVVHMTKDGKYFGSMSELIITDQAPVQQQVQTIEYSDADKEKLKTFNKCLADKGVTIYGANWCGWTKKLVVETLGGFDIAAPAYVECTENEDLCTQEGVRGYPTTKINGEVYQGERTIAAIAAETGCEAPELEGTGAVATSTGGSASAQC